MTELHYADAPTTGGALLTILGNNFGVNIQLISFVVQYILPANPFTFDLHTSPFLSATM